MEHIASGRDTKENRETDLDPLAIVQFRDGSGFAQTGSMNLGNNA